MSWHCAGCQRDSKEQYNVDSPASPRCLHLLGKSTFKSIFYKFFSINSGGCYEEIQATLRMPNKIPNSTGNHGKKGSFIKPRVAKILVLEDEVTRCPQLSLWCWHIDLCSPSFNPGPVWATKPFPGYFLAQLKQTGILKKKYLYSGTKEEQKENSMETSVMMTSPWEELYCLWLVLNVAFALLRP